MATQTTSRQDYIHRNMNPTPTYHIWANFDGIIHYWTTDGWKKPGTAAKIITFVNHARAWVTMEDVCMTPLGPRKNKAMEVDISMDNIDWPAGTVAQ